ncbi:hypothetical protein R1T16_16355 [Flavobacterium sp. DG1-102-2]|uniref:hypothetical protein n=1 Tax=Flavobacterium sp. DG1-102-2 TaxID=3081663 RepID=UPI00294A37CE|nr:hypothetical protein [Flavobacterium sp. DG1-102-2]MDV6170012.1 hypothetical protein [Flavobacterium sp. DG1-102-2]
MTTLLHSDTIKQGFNLKDVRVVKPILDLMYSTSQMEFSTKYIDMITSSIGDDLVDHFRNYIVELYVENRITITNLEEHKDEVDDEFINLAINSPETMTIPVTATDTKNLKSSVPNILVLDRISPINIEWIKYELLTKNRFVVSCHNFTCNTEIKSFVESIFKLPRIIREVSIFDRERYNVFFSIFKNKHIHYYTRLDRKTTIPDLHDSQKELRKQLGGKLKLYYSRDSKLIHERKVLFEGLLVTFDNSHVNTNISEPTWEISVLYDPSLLLKWKAKCTKFFPLR